MKIGRQVEQWRGLDDDREGWVNRKAKERICRMKRWIGEGKKERAGKMKRGEGCKRKRKKTRGRMIKRGER